MSSRIRSEFGPLGQRTTAAPRVRHVEVADAGSWHPGVLIGWQRTPDGWWAEVAWVRDDALFVRVVAADRVRPAGTATSLPPC